MKNGYKILWTDLALEELGNTLHYLQENFTEKEIKSLARDLDAILEIISQTPNLFQKSEIKGVHKIVVSKYNTLYYRIKENSVEILSFFSNRQNPKKRKL